MKPVFKTITLTVVQVLILIERLFKCNISIHLYLFTLSHTKSLIILLRCVIN